MVDFSSGATAVNSSFLKEGLTIAITGRWVFKPSVFITVKVILSFASEI